MPSTRPLRPFHDGDPCQLRDGEGADDLLDAELVEVRLDGRFVVRVTDARVPPRKNGKPVVRSCEGGDIVMDAARWAMDEPMPGMPGLYVRTPFGGDDARVHGRITRIFPEGLAFVEHGESVSDHPVSHLRALPDPDFGAPFFVAQPQMIWIDLPGDMPDAAGWRALYARIEAVAPSLVAIAGDDLVFWHGPYEQADHTVGMSLGVSGHQGDVSTRALTEIEALMLGAFPEASQAEPSPPSVERGRPIAFADRERVQLVWLGASDRLQHQRMVAGSTFYQVLLGPDPELVPEAWLPGRIFFGAFAMERPEAEGGEA
jgi:hypothetical protein